MLAARGHRNIAQRASTPSDGICIYMSAAAVKAKPRYTPFNMPTNLYFALNR